VRFEIPDSNVASILEPRQLHRLPNPAKAIVEAMAYPIGADPLSSIVREGTRAAILVSDKTRPCPSYEIIPSVVSELLRLGLKKSDITIFFANGTHKGHAHDEQRTLVGQEIADNFRLVEHNCREEGNFVSLGKTTRGTEVSVNRRMLDNDLIIGVANLDVHYFAGYSGGAKSIVPGMAAFHTIRQNHSLMLLPEAEAGVADGNPVREDLEEAAGLAGLDFIVNVVLNDEREIVHVVAGHYVKAHRSGIPPNDYMYKTSVLERADIVVATVGGYPKDMSLYQAQKGLDNAARAVRDGGTIILLAECREGLGDETFERWLMEADSPDSAIGRLKENFTPGGHKAFAIARVAKRAQVILVSNLASNVARRAFMTPSNSIKEAMREAFNAQGRGASIILMPYAGSTLPCLSK